MGVREWVEEKADRVKQRYQRDRADVVERRATDRFMEREREIERREDIDQTTGQRHGVSEELANKWRNRASRKYSKEKVPVEQRAWISIKENVKDDVQSSKRRLNAATSPKAIKQYRSSYSKASKSGLAGSGAGSQREPRQYGNFLITGSPTKKPKASGWSILYGSSSTGKSSSTRKKGGKDKGEGGSGGWLF